MLKLPDVTICAVDCAMPHLAARAIALSMQQCQFADALLLSDMPVPSRARHVAIPRIDSLAAYSRFMLTELVHHITTPYVLVVQWDGYVVDAGQWDPRFLDHDYIGAPWDNDHPRRQVGNGGFSLRSRRLLQACAEMAGDTTDAEDTWIGNTNRPLLEAVHGIRYAPTALASRFAFEYVPPTQPTFGFHGVINLQQVNDDQALIALAEAMPRRSIGTVVFAMMVLSLVRSRRNAAARALARLMTEAMSPEFLLQSFCILSGSEAAGRQAFDTLFGPTPTEGC